MADGYDDATRDLITEALQETIGNRAGILFDHTDTDRLLAWLDKHGIAVGDDATPEHTFEQVETGPNVNVNINMEIGPRTDLDHLAHALATIRDCI